MKISGNWLRQFIDYKCTPEELSALLTGCGLEVEHLEHWQSLQGGLEGIVTGKVLTCERHPNADRLSVTTVDAGDGVVRQIVCGAPNVAAGQKVIVALPGAMMYPTSGEPFEIKKSKIRGEVSDGMICAEDEIGLGTSHAGIIILPEDTATGIPASEYFKIEKDVVFEIGLTPNRADAASHLGVARDIKALLSAQQAEIKMPAIAAVNATQISPVKVVVEDVEACPRYSGIYIENITVAESPDWLKNRLRSIGIRPISNVVDITNYVMHELGQPLHAFDADKIADKTILVKTLAAGTIFKTLDGADRKLAGHELMIADAKGGLCIAGVFGGTDSGVSDTSKSVFLESACFNPVRVRKAARQHGLHTDSSFRFERGTDPEMTMTALLRAAALIAEIAGGKLNYAPQDFYPKAIAPAVIDLSLQYLEEIIGAKIPLVEVKRIITSLGMKIKVETAEALTIEVPAFKVDVTRPADLAEEILRIYGYNAIELPKKLSFSQAPLDKPDPWLVENRISAFLAARGFNEILANSLTSVSFSEIIPPASGDVVRVLNPLSSDLSVLRQSMLITGLQTIAYNLNRQQKNLRFFENGFAYHKNAARYEEQRFLSLLLTGQEQEASWNTKAEPFTFFSLKSVLTDLLVYAGVNVQKLKLADAESSTGNFYHLLQGNKKLAMFGKVDRKVLKQFDISQEVWYAEINFDLLLRQLTTGMVAIPPPPRFPEVRRDLSMVLDQQVRYQDIEKLAFTTIPDLLKEVNLFDVYEGEKIGAGKKSYAMSFLLRDEEQTLQDQRIDKVMEKLMKQLEEKLGVMIRKG
jgi:phenylalanyl-tRNA synthetase beta chain